MVNYKSFNNIVLDILNNLKLTQPSLDTKPGSVARDLFVDSQAQQIALIYNAIKEVANKQAVYNLTGQDLINYGLNFGISKQSGTKAFGTAILTFKSIDSDLSIYQNSVVRSRNGVPFLTVSSVQITTSQANSLRATATKYRQQLNTAGITDEFAVEVSVQAQSIGTAGNISQYSLVSHNISGVSNVTNVVSFTGGTNIEDDSSYRARILATFAGSNIGTSIGYRSVVLSLAEAQDALVVEPGDPLMLRDGTVTALDSDGNLIVSQPGTGGRVDIYIMGENIQSSLDSFVYYDKSGTGNANSSENDYILGQSGFTSSTNLTLNSRRVATLSGDAEIPNQPVSKITSVSGSSSGPNFIEQYLDTETGEYKGNFKLIKDTGYAGGSVFSLDKLSWTDNQVEFTGEAGVKGNFNSVDQLAYTEVSEILDVTQDVQVINENSSIGTSRSYIMLKHTPVRTVSRVFNLTTGERYIITNQNPDGTGILNTSGKIQISGGTLPTQSDILQVDYTWVFPYDRYTDFDNLNPADPLGTTQDSIDWGFSNYIRNEYSKAILDAYGNLTVSTQYPISRILSVNSYNTEVLTVLSGGTLITSNSVANILSIKNASGFEVYNTYAADGIFSNLLITLPSDTVAEVGDLVTIIYNTSNIANIDGYESGLFVNNKISILPNYIVPTNSDVIVNYVMDYLSVIPSGTPIVSFPISGDGKNSFSGIDGYQPFLNTFSGSAILSNKRKSPSNLVVSLSSIPVSGGSIRIHGITMNKVVGNLIVTTDGMIDVSSLIKSVEKATSIPNIYIGRVIKVQKISTNVSGNVSSIDYEYDLTNYGIKYSRWDMDKSVQISSLSPTIIQLSSTEYNNNFPIITGTKIRVEFYYIKQNDYEDLYFSKNGTLITNKRFGYISSISRLSGLQDSGGTITGSIRIDTFNQPSLNETYTLSYKYKAPKDNERITINYEYNKLIVDATTAIEDKRPITADVLVKGASKIEVDVSATIIVSQAYKDKKSTVKQDVADNITSTLTANSLQTTIDSSDVIANAYNVPGLDRIKITRFNRTNASGTKLSISAQKNEYISPGIILVETEER